MLVVIRRSPVSFAISIINFLIFIGLLVFFHKETSKEKYTVGG